MVLALAIIYVVLTLLYWYFRPKEQLPLYLGAILVLWSVTQKDNSGYDISFAVVATSSLIIFHAFRNQRARK